MSKLTVYLAGAIRDGRTDDIAWREQFISALSDQIDFLNPLAGKHYDETTKLWTMNGQPSTAKNIVLHDFWCVDRADLIVFNLLALAEGYPNIGSLVEYGRATARGCLIYSIIQPQYKGHGNLAMYALHPFIEQPSSLVFSSPEECLAFLSQKVRMLTGSDAHYVYKKAADDSAYQEK